MRESPHWLCAWNADRMTGLKLQRHTSPQWVYRQTDIETKYYYLHYTQTSQSLLTKSPSLFSHPSPPRGSHELSPESIPSQNDLESLSDRGSLARKEAVTGKRNEKVTTLFSQLYGSHWGLRCVLCPPNWISLPRWYVDNMLTSQLAHFSEGKDTPTTKVLQVSYYNKSPLHLV